jgi:hypothetical protein
MYEPRSKRPRASIRAITALTSASDGVPIRAQRARWRTGIRRTSIGRRVRDVEAFLGDDERTGADVWIGADLFGLR